MKKFILTSFVALFFLACGSNKQGNGVSNSQATATNANQFGLISGSINYRTRQALPTPHTVVLDLYEVSEVGNILVVTTQFSNNTQVPIPFEFAYDLSLVNENGNYLLNARIIGPDGAAFMQAAELVNPFANPNSDVVIMLGPIKIVPADDEASTAPNPDPAAIVITHDENGNPLPVPIMTLPATITPEEAGAN
jgi:uncharacterized lipoprotein YbaY